MNAVVPLDNQPQMLVQLGTLQASTPAALVSGATQIADTLATIIRKNKLATTIQGKEYVRVEGWTTLAALLGVIPREDSVESLEDGGYIAKVSLVRMADGAVISSASSECGMDEPTWAGRARYARRSMAVTRATGKAARLAFSWVMALAGFEATPAEEMPSDRHEQLPADTVPSGKHRGKKWSDIGDDYLGWVISSPKAPAHLKEGAQVETDRRSKPFVNTSGQSDDDDIPF